MSVEYSRRRGLLSCEYIISTSTMHHYWKIFFGPQPLTKRPKDSFLSQFVQPRKPEQNISLLKDAKEDSDTEAYLYEII